MNAILPATKNRTAAAPEKRSFAEVVALLQRHLRQTFAVYDTRDGHVLHGTASTVDAAVWRADLARQWPSLEEARVVRFGGALACLLIPLKPLGFSQAIAAGTFRTAAEWASGELFATAERLAVSPDELVAWHERQPIFSVDALDCLGRLAQHNLAADWRNTQLDFQAEHLSRRIGERLEDLELLYQIIAGVRDARDPAELAHIILDWAIHSLPAEQAIVQFFEPGMDEATKDSVFFHAGQEHLDSESFDRLLAHLQPDITNGPLVRNVDATRTDEWPFPTVRELIVAPIHSDRSLAGWLVVINHAARGWLGNHQARLLHAAASVMGMRAILREMRLLREASDAANFIKTRILANVSHELRTPLNGILSFSKSLREGGLRDDADCHEGLETIERCGRRLAEVVDDLLEMQHIDRGRITVKQIECRVEDAILSVISKLQQRAADKGLVLDAIGLESIGDSIHTDPQRLNQLLSLLVGNAIKFTEQGGVRVVARMGDGGQRRLQIDVQDSGVGIPSHMLETVFDPFAQVDPSSTRAYDGLGLGLSICRRLAHSLGGTLTVHSQPGAGSTFTFELTAAAPAASGNDGVRDAADWEEDSDAAQSS